MQINPNTRFLVIGTGRCGTSLLSAILADAGADFGMEAPDGWRRVAGAFEHDEVQRACAAFKTSRKFAAVGDTWWGFRKLRRLHVRTVKKALRRLFDRARYAKSMDLVSLTHTIFKLDYDPRVVIVYRDFANVAMSTWLAFAWTHEEALKHYLETYRTGLIQLHLFGGCAVGWDEITDRNETAWAEALAEVTGLERDRLLAARDARLKPMARKHAAPSLSPEADALHEALTAYRGRVVEPSGHIYVGDKH